MAIARVSASKARAYTRKGGKNPASFARLISGLWFKIVVLVMTILLSWAVVAFRAPPPKICGAPGGPPVTATRVKLSDGRYLAYKEAGVPKEVANHKVIINHAFGRSRHDLFPVSKETIQKLGIYLVGYDRPGYGQSDPNPRRSVKSSVQDIEELADFLELGSKFHIFSYSIGGHTAWGALKHIPHRLAGVAMVVPVVNYWWPTVSTPEGKAVFDKLPVGDRLFLSVAHYVPWLTYWWMTQKILPTSSTMNPTQDAMCPSDWETRTKMRNFADPKTAAEPTQQGLQESLCRDTIVMFGKWEFDPAEIENPNIPVHVWQGERDFLVPAKLQRMIMKKLPWIKYHEFADKGHYLIGVPGLPDEIFETLVSGHNCSG